MAYLFNSVSDEGEAGKQNIFGGQQTDQGTTSGGAFDKGAAPPSGSSGGGGGGAPAGGSGQSAGQKQQAAYNPQAASAAYASASKSMNLPQKTLQRAEGSLAKSSQQLQEQADAYGKKAQDTSQTYGLDEKTLQEAAQGKGEAYQKTAQRLQGGNPAERFEGFEAGPVANVDYLRDPSQAFRADAGPRYTSGQSRFDAALLRRNPEFIARQQELLGRGQALQKEASAREESETKKARELLGSAYGKETDAIKGKLGGMSEAVITAAKERELKEEARRAGLDPKAIAREQLKIAKKQAKEDLSYAAPGSAQYREGELLDYVNDEQLVNDLAGNVKINKDVDWRQMLGQEDVGQYNRLQGLLGNADMLTQGGPLGADYDFRMDDAYRALGSKTRDARMNEEYVQSPQGQADLARAIGAQGPIFSGNLDIPNIQMTPESLGLPGEYKPAPKPKPVKSSGGSSASGIKQK